jgi:DNA-binding PadR family transcriptional regulator
MAMSGRETPDPLDCRVGWDGLGCGRRGCGRRAGGGGRGRGRVFDNGDLRLVIMLLLSERPRHGYEIIKALEERVGGGYSPSPGVVYPTLTLLEELGHASVSDERGGRKLYTLTDDGMKVVGESRATVDAIFARVAGDAAARGGPPPPVARAMENLNLAVRLRLQGRSATAAQIRAIAASIDAAARAVEEL